MKLVEEMCNGTECGVSAGSTPWVSAEQGENRMWCVSRVSRIIGFTPWVSAEQGENRMWCVSRVSRIIGFTPWVSAEQGENRMWCVSRVSRIIGFTPGSALSTFLFVAVLDELSESARKEYLWELLFADDLGILAMTEDELQSRVVEWQEALLESKGLRVNGRKHY